MRMGCQQATTLLESIDEPRGIGRIAASNEVADLDQIPFGLVGEPKLRHRSTGGEPLFKPREHFISTADAAGCQIVETCLKVSLESRKFFRLAFGGFDRHGKTRVRRRWFWKSLENAFRQLRR